MKIRRAVFRNGKWEPGPTPAIEISTGSTCWLPDDYDPDLAARCKWLERLLDERIADLQKQINDINGKIDGACYAGERADKALKDKIEELDKRLVRAGQRVDERHAAMQLAMADKDARLSKLEAAERKLATCAKCGKPAKWIVEGEGVCYVCAAKPTVAAPPVTPADPAPVAEFDAEGEADEWTGQLNIEGRMVLQQDFQRIHDEAYAAGVKAGEAGARKKAEAAVKWLRKETPSTEYYAIEVVSGLLGVEVPKKEKP